MLGWDQENGYITVHEIQTKIFKDGKQQRWNYFNQLISFEV